MDKYYKCTGNLEVIADNWKQYFKIGKHYLLSKVNPNDDSVLIMYNNLTGGASRFHVDADQFEEVTPVAIFKGELVFDFDDSLNEIIDAYTHKTQKINELKERELNNLIYFKCIDEDSEHFNSMFTITPECYAKTEMMVHPVTKRTIFRYLGVKYVGMKYMYTDEDGVKQFSEIISDDHKAYSVFRIFKEKKKPPVVKGMGIDKLMFMMVEEHI